MTARLAVAAATLGAALIVAGVAVIHWPTAMVVAGIMLLAAALAVEVDEER